MIHKFFKSLFTDSSHIKFGRPLPLFSLPDRLIIPLRTGASADLRWIYPNHLKQCCTSFSSTDATPSLSRMSSFRTRSLLVLPQIHRSMRISDFISALRLLEDNLIFCVKCKTVIEVHKGELVIAASTTCDRVPTSTTGKTL
jgi:hypothetical protein